MYNLDIFKLPPRYVEAEKLLAELRGLGNCEGYITGHQGSDRCFDLSFEFKINIKFFPDGSGVEASFWDSGLIVRDFFFKDFEAPELAHRFAIVSTVIAKLGRIKNRAV